MTGYLICGLFLLLAAAIIAGCTGTGGQTPQSLSAPATTPESTTTATLPADVSVTPTFALGDHYVQKSYSFHTSNDQYTEQVRIDNSSWAVAYKVTPLSDNINASWFMVTITNVDTQKSQTFGYGRTYAYDAYQQYPMYGPGAYEVSLSGNLTKVDLDIAKRLP